LAGRDGIFAQGSLAPLWPIILVRIRRCYLKMMNVFISPFFDLLSEKTDPHIRIPAGFPGPDGLMINDSV
jgi:hypothetical protein